VVLKGLLKDAFGLAELFLSKRQVLINAEISTIKVENMKRVEERAENN